VTATGVGGGAAVAPARIPEPAPKPKSRALYVLAGIVIALFFLVYASTHNIPNQSVTPIERLVRQQRTVTAKNPDLHLNALGFSSFKLDVPAGATGVNLHGNFTASGGLANDVEVFVLSADDFVNWQNRHAARSIYNSGRVTVGTLNVNLPSDAATYYLVFNNRFSLLTQRSVMVDTALTYYQ
jgi:hypothetical protein